MGEEIKHIEISFNSEWFQSCYSVYVLTITHSGNEYFYIGQTGDRKHVSARSPFYRLMGHYSPYQGTDTQLVMGLIKHNLIHKPEDKSLRVCLEDAFYNKHITVKADYFKIIDFDELDHPNKRKLAEKVEQLLIDHFKIKRKELFNNISESLIQKAKMDEEAVRVFDKIIEKVSL